MRNFTTLLLIAALAVLSGCSYERKKSAGASVSAVEPQAEKSAPSAQASKDAAGLMATFGGNSELNPQALQVSLTNAANVQAAGSAADRKIIRNGELTIETDSPTDAQSKITAVAESLAGFVVTSEFKQNAKANQSQSSQTVMVVARVPSAYFNAALERIRETGRVAQEKVSGQDVSEEYLDLEARIRTKKALEAQFLEIMKQAKKVSEALEVQNELADVRTEIERLEGRRRFLENQSAFSTITVTLQMPAPIVVATTSSFGQSIKETFGDAVDTAAAILLGLIRFIILLVPVALFIGLPGWLIWRVVRRRLNLPKKPEQQIAES